MSIQLTDQAIQRIHDLTDGTGKRLRVTVSGGGCSGFQYTFGLDDAVHNDDQVFEREGATLVIDTASLDVVDGSLVDFVEDMTTSQFILKNPSAVSACGCGKSFAI